MSSMEILADAFGRIQEAVHQTVEGLSREELAFRVDEQANTVGWLVWHLTRIQDDHVCDLAQTDQLWTSAGWADRFGLPFEVSATGYGHTSDDVARVQVEPELLLGYHDAVCAQTLSYLRALPEAELGRIVDESWDPPVSLQVRLVSVIADDLQHAGQAAFVRGVVQRRQRA